MPPSLPPHPSQSPLPFTPFLSTLAPTCDRDRLIPTISPTAHVTCNIAPPVSLSTCLPPIAATSVAVVYSTPRAQASAPPIPPVSTPTTIQRRLLASSAPDHTHHRRCRLSCQPDHALFSGRRHTSCHRLARLPHQSEVSLSTPTPTQGLPRLCPHRPDPRHHARCHPSRQPDHAETFNFLFRQNIMIVYRVHGRVLLSTAMIL